MQDYDVDKKRGEFEDSILKLRELYEEYPIVVVNEVNSTIERIKLEGKNHKRWASVSSNFYGIFIPAVFIFLLGFVNFKSCTMYLFGLAFFLAGVAVGLSAKGFGIIFLFSHGLTGMGFMIASQIGGIISNPVMSDLSSDARISLFSALGLFVVGFIIVIIINLSDKLRNSKGIFFVPMVIFAIAFLVTVLFPKMYGIEPFNIFM